MSDMKKFLDAEGVKHLWSKVNMQDYPNNETLMSVINAIDETKADRSELVQSDWNQSDETALDYVKNRTHYDETLETVLIDKDITVTEPYYDEQNDFYYSFQPHIQINKESTYNITFLGETFYDLQLSKFNTIEFDLNNGVHITLDTSGIRTMYAGNITRPFDTYLKVVEIQKRLCQLDEKYIPDTIARVEDVVDMQVQSDWNQNDETSLAYIQNRTHYDNSNITYIIEDCVGIVVTDGGGSKIFYDASLLNWTLNNSYHIKWDGIEYEAVCKENADGFYEYEIAISDTTTVEFWEHGVIYSTGSSYLVTDDTHTYAIYTKYQDLKKLDEKYIPWPDENDALELLSEIGMVEAAAAADGSIYIEDTGVIYTL